MLNIIELILYLPSEGRSRNVLMFHRSATIQYWQINSVYSKQCWDPCIWYMSVASAVIHIQHNWELFVTSSLDFKKFIKLWFPSFAFPFSIQLMVWSLILVKIPDWNESCESLHTKQFATLKDLCKYTCIQTQILWQYWGIPSQHLRRAHTQYENEALVLAAWQWP